MIQQAKPPEELSETIARIMERQGLEEWELDPNGIKADLCGCTKPKHCYGSNGWHVEVKPDGTEVVYARCEPYLQAIEDRRAAEKAINAIRRRWGAMNEGEKAMARRDLKALHGRGRVAREKIEELKSDNGDY